LDRKRMAEEEGLHEIQPAEPAVSEKPKRRWYQFSLKTLLVVLTLLCLGPGGWMAYQHHRDGRRQTAIDAIEKVGGKIHYGNRVAPRSFAMQVFLGNERFENLDELRFTSNWKLANSDLVHVQQFPGLQILALADTQITDDGLVHLANLVALKELDLEGTPITDSGLVHLAGSNTLKNLRLENTPITDSGLRHLAGLTELEILHLDNTNVTDTGLVNLSRMKKLVTLTLMDTDVTDSGLLHLASLTKLEWLWLDGAKVSQAGIGRLGKSLPNLNIVCSSPVPSPPTVDNPFADFPGVEILPNSPAPAPSPPKP
jgi:Leucine-rich repeat (LRR) protein